jgi:phage gp29-like protein
MSLLSDFLLLGSDRVGSFALGTAKVDLWTLAVDSIAKTIAEVVNQFAIPRLLKLNAMRMDRMPELTYGQVSSVELGEVADYVSKLMGVGAIMPDPSLEGHLRSLGDLPDSEPLI